MSAEASPFTRCGTIALLGAPNAGKSTLINALVGQKISIVSRKVQTTRFNVRGVAQHGDSQLIFIDTPGLFAPRKRLDHAMVKSAWRGAGDADVLALLVDAQRGFDALNVDLTEKLKERAARKILILTKIDLVARAALLDLAQRGQELLNPDALFMISATHNDGLPALLHHLAAAMPAGPWLFAHDALSDMSAAVQAAEITREFLFDRLHDELPYAVTVETERWDDQKDGSVKISQVIYVERVAHKKMVIGQKGATIKSLSMAARQEMMKAFDQKVHLFLFVKVRENWSDDPERYHIMNLEFPS